MAQKIYSSASGKELTRKRRRRIGEFTLEVINFKKSLSKWELIQLETKKLSNA